MRSTAFARLALVVGVLLVTGCSSFNRDWNAMAAAPAAGVAPASRWEGRWVSNGNGHSGGLRCILTTTDDAALSARYRATFGPGLTFEYTVLMAVEHDGDTSRFSGTADLGWLAGGDYEYEGTVVGDRFTSTYESRRDHGTFDMTRAVAP